MKEKSGGLVWDFPTRIFHWGLVIAITTSFLSVRNDMMELHFQAGGFVLFLILFRVFWGIIGPETAQFHKFVPTPARIQQWKQAPLGHSPLGALSVFALIGFIGLQASLGLFTDDEIYLTGPLRDYVDRQTASTATSYHALISKVVFALVLLHLAAILFYTLLKRSDILRVFLTGKRKDAPQSIKPRPWYLVVITVVLSALPVLWIFS